MKNHYISQFVIRRFSNAINIFNINTGSIDETKRPTKVFYKNDIYDEELEKLFNFNIESKIANLLDKKIINQDTITLTRTEIELLKRYMLICSVRTLEESFFCNLLKGFKKNADLYIKFFDEYSSMKYTEALNLTDKELYLRTLKVFATTTNIRDIANNPLATREMLAWALPFLESYIAFWDTPNGKEYILTDCGMCSEYEGFHMITGGLDISKNSFLYHKCIKEKKFEYGGIYASNALMYENYSIFNLSSTRSMVMINPFFRMYHKTEVYFLNNVNKKYTLDEPDIWPAIIQNRSLFDVPKNEYKISSVLKTRYDLFIYTPKILTNEDLIYINALMLSQTNEIIGFNDCTKIVESIYYYIWYESNFKSVTKKNQDDFEVLYNLIDNISKSPFNELCKYCESKGAINKTEIFMLFEKLLSYIYKDFKENSYICEYYLANPQETAKCKNLDFLGEGNKKIEFFRKHLNDIMEKQKNDK